MPLPFISLRLGSYSCVCVLDPQDQCGAPESMAGAEGADSTAEGTSMLAEDVRRFDDPGPAVATIAAAPPVSVTRPAAVPAVPQSTEGHLQVGGSSSSAVVLPHLNPLNGRSWPWPPSPVPHHRAGERRQRARDAFNMQELLFGDALAQRDFSDPSVEDIGQLLSDDSPALNGWGRGSFRVQLRDLQTLIRDVEGRELDNSEVAWVLRLALRKQEGPALLRPSCLRYALLARHGFQSLSFPELQLSSSESLGHLAVQHL
ncbi:unnamed protein product [Durusdinium trenchii]|uniref:Uncharacterized protein n=1 Tax=Durusdinium trenchii TaxID=1381693 RepID=A0ABP0PBS9_9DINO